MEIMIILGLIILNGFFAMSEMAMVSAKQMRLKLMAEEGSGAAEKVIELQGNSDRMLSTIQVGITMIALLSGIMGEKALITPITEIFVSMGVSAGLANTLASIIGLVGLAFLSVVFGEIIPKRIGLVMPEKIAVIAAYPMIFLSKIAFPVVWMFSAASSFMLKLLKLNNIKQAAMSEEEVKEAVVQSIKEGGITAENGELIENVLHLDKRSANAIMTTRADFYYIDVNASFEKTYETLVNSKFSKVLVMNEETEEIFGYVYLKNILSALCKKEEFNVMDYIKSLIVLPETVTPIQILSKIKTKSEAALIINEYGENIGLVCLSDVLEALVGDVDVAEENDVQEITKIDENKYLVDGELDFKQLEKLVGAALEEDPHVHTVSGVVMKIAAEVPKTGYKFEIISLNNKKKIIGMVVDMDKNFVDKVEIEITDISLDEVKENVEEVPQ